MKTFHCDVCGNLVFFENTHCVNCHHALGFIPALLELSALVPETEGGERVVAPAASGHLFRHCGNRDTPAACNWLVPAAETGTFCAACRLDEIIPDLSIAENSEHWHQLEAAKRRLIYTLLKLHLPFAGTAHGKPPLRFRFLGDPPGGPAILTGHEHGTITVNVAEADDLIREQRRASLHEPFRTLLGHFRHEAAHYYWEVLVEGTAWLEPFRTLFGDERADYGEALRRHHAHGPDAGWEKHWVSAYASSHPWEDWAETCAHYLHIIDTIETAASFGLSLRPQHPAARTMTADPQQAATGGADFKVILDTWFPLTYALNSLNRGMGLPDLYPFVLSTPAIEKLRFVHQVIGAAAQAPTPDLPDAAPALAAASAPSQEKGR